MKKKKVQGYIISLQQQLGEGSFGKVYKGIHQQTKQSVAIKVLSKKDIDDDEYVKQALMSEIKIMKKLNSEFIVRFIDVLTTANNYYIVQQLCDGDLRKKMKKNKGFSQKQALRFIQQICRGFKFLISNGIIHRDMKPENILIIDNKLKLADFGFAKNVISKTQLNHSIVGTPIYMAPQLLKNQKYSSKCDIWAVGLIFYELIYGKSAWTGKSQYELIKNILNIPLKFPNEPQISVITKNFISGCLRLEQKQRFSWDQVYEHEIFEGRLKNSNKADKLNEKAKYVINKLRLKIHSDNIDLEKLFLKLKLNNQTSIKKKQFFDLLNTLHEQIDQQEALFVFNKFDIDRNGTIEFNQFKKCLEENDIRFNSIQVASMKKSQSQSLEGQQQSTEESKINQVILKLNNRIEAQKLDLLRVYSSYDTNKDDSLTFDEFRKLISKIDNNLTLVELQLCFNRFDLNKDKKISFDEFYKTLCKIAGQPNLKSRKDQKQSYIQK